MENHILELEASLEICVKELTKKHGRKEFKYLRPIAEAYMIYQERYEKLTGHFYHPKDL